MVGRFAVRDLHARGGLGEVYKAQDTELNREVALKKIQTRFADDASCRRRFLSEAELTARLDHPGVVPVFGLVADGFGRPCYAMRFIRGESLKDEIDRYFRPPAPAAPGAVGGKTEDGSPGNSQTADSRRIAFRQLLQRFTAVCQAIAYAHTRNVIHRDIKPANVMVGTFGETLVVDWGLAKALDDPQTPEESQTGPTGAHLNPNGTGSSDQMTTMGTVVGTPAFMSPEQAAGRIDIIGPASDVYSLGATLYYILTGKSPFTGNDPTLTISRVQEGTFPPPREVAGDVSKPLEAICLKAMATRPEDRYPTAQALAADVDRWLSDEPVSCHRDPLAARLARWARRHPARVAAAVSLLFTGFLAAAVILFVVDQARKQTEESLIKVTKAEDDARQALKAETAAKEKTRDALDKLTDQEKQTRDQRDAAERARDLAKKRFGLASKAFEKVVFEIQSQLEDRSGTQRLRQSLLQTAQEGLNDLLTSGGRVSGAERHEADRVLFGARVQMGDVYKSLGNTLAARNEYETAVESARALRSTDPEDQKNLATGYYKLAEIRLQAGETTKASEAAREALDLRTTLLTLASTNPDARGAVAAAQDRLALVAQEQGHTREAWEACQTSRDIRASLYARAIVTSMGIIMSQTSRDIRASLYAAAPANTKTAQEAGRDLAQSHEREADILLRMGNLSGAEAAVRKALTLREKLAKELPDRVEVQREWAAAYARLGEVNIDRADMGGALTAFETELGILKKVGDKDPLSAGVKADEAVARGRIGYVLLRTGKIEQALKETEQSNDLCRELAKTDPGSGRIRRLFGKSYEYLGDARLERGDTAGALQGYREGRVILEKLQKDDPASVRTRMDLAQNLERIGSAELAAGRFGAAFEALIGSSYAREELVGADPDSTRARRDLAISHDRLCYAHQLAGNPLLARVEANRAFALFKELAEKDPGSGQAQRDLGLAYGKWGDVALHQNSPTVALILYGKSLDLFDKLALIDKLNVQANEDQAIGWQRLANIYTIVELPIFRFEADKRVLLLREAVATANPTNLAAARAVMTSRRRLGDVYSDRDEFNLAKTTYQEALKVPAQFTEVDKKLVDAVFGTEITTVHKKLELLEAIRARTRDPVEMMKEYPTVGPEALVELIDRKLRAHDRLRAVQAAEVLEKHARGANDLYIAARTYAVCYPKTGSAATQKDFADSAVRVLKQAVAAGFRNADQLQDSRWDVVRDREDFRAVETTLRNYTPPIPAPRVVEPSSLK
jgi:serine/threonine protein kinase